MSALRLSTEADLPQIMAIIAQAQAYLASRGVDQWQDGYPDEETMREDIRLRRGYVLADGDSVQGIATIVFDGESSYARIYDGAWRTPEPYACIHRIAVNADARGTGAADALMRGAEDTIRRQGMTGVRIDTHRDNVVMQRMLARNGYSVCGVIYLEGGSEHGAERIALEKTL